MGLALAFTRRLHHTLKALWRLYRKATFSNYIFSNEEYTLINKFLIDALLYLLATLQNADFQYIYESSRFLVKDIVYFHLKTSLLNCRERVESVEAERAF